MSDHNHRVLAALSMSVALVAGSGALYAARVAAQAAPAPGEKIPPVVPLAKSLDAPTEVPPSLRVPSTQKLAVGAHAKGVQIYVCQSAPNDVANFAWVLKGPEATLMDAQGVTFGKHYAGPTWEYYDGSRVVGTVVARYDAPDGASIPWLLLTAKTSNGDGGLSRVQYVQRLHTAGGKVPERGCDKEREGTEARIDYSADYYFYVAI